MSEQPSQPGDRPEPRPSRPVFAPGDIKRPPPRGGHGKSAPFNLPPLEVMTTTLWSYPSQHYWSPRLRRLVGVAGARYTGATPSWVIWQLLTRYTCKGDTVVDPMAGSGTTLDVCEDMERKGLGFDLNPQRAEIKPNDARSLPLKDSSVDFVFIDPPYSTHVHYSDDPRCIGRLNSGGADRGAPYYKAMTQVLREVSRVLKPGGHAALYVSDSYVKGAGFMPIGFNLFDIMRKPRNSGGAGLTAVDTAAVVRGNQKLAKPNWHRAAEDGNFFLRGFNYLFIMRK